MPAPRALFATLLAVLFAPAVFAADPVSGEAVYKKRCATCHDTAGDRIPTRATLSQMRASRILRTLDSGAMMTVAYPMGRQERESVARYLGLAGAEPPPPASAFCKDRRVDLGPLSQRGWNGWSPKSDNARFVPAENSSLRSSTSQS